EEDCASGSSDEEWLPVQTGASREVGSSSGSEVEESVNVAEGVETEEGDEADEGDEDNQFEGDLPPFLGRARMNVEGADPIDFFMHLFTQDMINDIVHNTNLYAVQKGKDKLALTSEEFKTFLGINMVMSYVRYPRSRMYWSSETGLRLELIADAMPVNRFEQILRYMHFVDNYSLDPKNADRFVKIRPVLDALKETFQSALDPEEFQSVDEMMIPYKGRLSIKQYVPKKPKPWGIKVWVRAGSSGYMYNFEPYQGPAGGRGEISQLGMAGDVVMRLCQDIQDKNHKVFFDNFFCTIPLLQALEHQGIYGTGTCRSNRLHGAQKKLKKEKQMKQEGRGSVSVVTNAQNITITRWLDSSVIHMASSCTGLSPTDVAQRWSKKEKRMLNIQRPFSVKLYNQHMGGVDLMDQCVAMYPHRRRNKRWYIRVFFHFLDVTTVNAWLLYRMSGNEAKDLLHFKASIARSQFHHNILNDLCDCT
uniref:PiggyBac transposable element-derived protein domain-containing protein n=1 Tax=Astyanax mexicanus TaxID=7994 RepID=A0A3B1KIQ1_ASTMX